MKGFEQIIQSKLTPEQREAVLDPKKEILTLACAGSGKSRTLAFRIARLLSEKQPPKSITAFTFTNKAAETIKQRVSEALKSIGFDATVIGAMFIGTMHSYCQKILGEIDPIYRQFEVLDPNRMKLYLISRYWDLDIESFRIHRKLRYFKAIDKINHAWEIMNNELLDIQDIIGQDRELGYYLRDLKEMLRADQYIDFSLMIRNVVEKLKNNRSIKVLSDLKHLMCDEYQDITLCEAELIHQLHKHTKTLFVVGDDDQAIYAWRGADVSNILEFENYYPDCSKYTLSKNFRSTTPIVQASENFIKKELGPERFPKNPTSAHNIIPQDCRVLLFPDRPSEAKWVTDCIQTLLGTVYEESGKSARGLTPADFAILMRSTKTMEGNEKPRHYAFTEALNSMNIPFSLEAGGGVFDRPEVSVLRDTFELLREAPPERDVVQQHYEEKVLPVYKRADFKKLTHVLSDWGRNIHRVLGTTRIRLQPQQLIYDLLDAFNITEINFNDDVMRNIGLFSRMILDVETVYTSVDSKGRFVGILNFLLNIAEEGYDISTDDLLQRPDAVTVSTVHKMKGLEFPCVFLVDTEAQRFPKNKSRYTGLIPEDLMKNTIIRGAYQSTPTEEARLFYTAVTRAERYLYITAAENLPSAKRVRKPSKYSLRFGEHHDVHQENDPHSEKKIINLEKMACKRRIEDTDYPTNFTEISYYLRCPKSYQFRTRFGLNPPVPDMFGFGKTVHTSLQKLHEQFPRSIPSIEDAQDIVSDTFHLKHIPESSDPENRPGGYERAKKSALDIAQRYVQSYGDDFIQSRTLEATFEVPAKDCVITGVIDLILKTDQSENILDAEIIDFKTTRADDNLSPEEKVDWTNLSLQVQLYAHAAEKVLGQNARTGSVHFLKDNKRIEVPITEEAVSHALENIEWAVQRILASDFPIRPHASKCEACDYKMICPQKPGNFSDDTLPPELHLPEGRKMMIRAFSQYEADKNTNWYRALLRVIPSKSDH